MGTDAADTFMDYLPNAGWPEFATKQDLAVLAAELRVELAEQIGSVRADMSKQTRTIMMGMVGMTVTFVGSLVAAVVSIGH